MLGNTKLLFSDDDKEFEVDFSAGIAPTSQTKKRSAIESSDSSKQAEPSKPAIVFRKRKVRWNIMIWFWTTLITILFPKSS